MGFILAWTLVSTSSRLLKGLIWIAVSLPLLMGTVVKNYALLIILQRRGILNSILVGSGLAERPLQLLYNEAAVVIGILYTLLPFAVGSDLRRAADSRFRHGSRGGEHGCVALLRDPFRRPSDCAAGVDRNGHADLRRGNGILCRAVVARSADLAVHRDPDSKRHGAIFRHEERSSRRSRADRSYPLSRSRRRCR